MRLTKVGYQNLKGRTEEVDLSPATLIVGRNFRGKTTILDAIKLALLSYHPNHAKTGAGVFRLASGNPLTATVTLQSSTPNEDADGRRHSVYVVGNEWRADSRGAISKRTFGPPPGTIPETPIVSLDPLAYFAATPRQRVDLIFAAANVAAETVDFEAIEERLDELGVTPEKDQSNVSVWLDLMIERVERARSDAAATEKRFAATVQTAPQAAEAFPEKLGETLASTRKTLEGKVSTLAKLQPSAAAVEKIESEIRECLNKRDTLRLQIDEKAEEIEKTERTLRELLAHENCPTCGTVGRAWKATVKGAKEAEIVQLGVDRGNLVREFHSVEDAIALRKKDVLAARKRALKKDEKQRDKLNEEIAELREEIATLEATEDRKVAHESAEKYRASARKNWETAKRDAERYGAAKKHLLEVKDRLANTVFESVLAIARRFTDGIIDGRLEFMGSLGIRRGEFWVESETFSGTEQAIVFAAFQAALGAKAPVKLAILDELGRVDAENKTKLFDNIGQAIHDGVIDQFIGVDTTDDSPQGFALIRR
jgi:DNA repair exonuclease SbcCD ATPase subunit